jgi:hypothetical protein
LQTIAAGFAALAVVLAAAAPGVADTEIGSVGSGAGQAKDPRGLALDEADGLLYVADNGNSRIDVFDASDGGFIRAFGWGVLDGTASLQVCSSTCQAGLAGNGSGQLKEFKGIAFDNHAISPEPVYVFDAGNRRIQKFSGAGEFVWMAGDGVNVTTGGDLCVKGSGDVCGAGTGGNAEGQLNPAEGDTIDVGPAGIVYVGDKVLDGGLQKTRVQMWSPEGVYLGLLGGEPVSVTGGAGNTTALAVDSTGAVYLGTMNELGTGAVRKYDSDGNELAAFNPSFNVNTIAIGPGDDHVFVGDNSLHEGEFNSAINEYDPTGALVRVIYGALRDTTLGLAIGPGSGGDIFAVDLGVGGNKRILDIDFPLPGPVVYPDPSALFADPIGNTKATLHGKINPEGEATTYHFEYITDEAFKAAGETFGAGTVKTSQQGPLPADLTLRPVQVQLAGLFPETLYHWRLVVSSAGSDPGGNTGPIENFETRDPVEFGGAWSSEVGTTSVTIHAEANPLGIAATARFEYVELSEYESTGFANATMVPVPPEAAIDLGEGESMKEVKVSLSGLEEGVSYRYRLLATNRCKPEPAPLCDFSGPEGEFTAFRSDSPETCPNDLFRVGWAGNEPGPGEKLPDCRAFEMVSPIDKKGANIKALDAIPSGALGSMDRAAVDGNSLTYTSYKSFGNAVSAPYANQYMTHRDPGAGWLTEAISPKREGPALMTFLTATLDRQYKEFSDDLCRGWVVQDAAPVLSSDAIEGYPGLYRRDNCGLASGAYQAITTIEPPNLPPRKFIPEFQGASSDGSVAIFGVNDNLTGNAPAQPVECVQETSPSSEPCKARLYEYREGQLKYVCVLPDETPWAGDCGAGQMVSPFAGGAERSGNLQNAISKDGSRIFWSTSVTSADLGTVYVRVGGTETIQISTADAYFRGAAADGSKALYSEGQQLFVFDVASETSTPIAGGLFGVAGASEDLARVYFASSQVLTGSQENDFGAKATAGAGNLYLYEPDGSSQMTFIGTLSAAELAGTHSSLVSNAPTRRLVRVTPDGEHLAFMAKSPLTGYDNTDTNSKEADFEVYLYDAAHDSLLCPSCNPSGARPRGQKLKIPLLEEWAAARIPAFISQFYGSRILAEDGTRLYFNSFDRLSINDSNNAEDVYQWEEPGTGRCEESAPTYHEVSGGCLDLISSGRSPNGSELVDISADGRDVFLKTFESLVPQDPGLLDIYDARVEGGFAYPVPEPQVCEDGECQRPALPPAVAPTVSSNPGPPNPSWPRSPKCRKGAHKVKTKANKVRCVKNAAGRRHKHNASGGRSR